MNLRKIIFEEISTIKENDYYVNRSSDGELLDLEEDLERYRKYVGDAEVSENDDIAKKSFEKASYILEIFEDVFESMMEGENLDYFSYEEHFSGNEYDMGATKLSASKLADSLRSFLDKVNNKGTKNIEGDLKKILTNVYLVQFMIYNLPEKEGEQ